MGLGIPKHLVEEFKSKFHHRYTNSGSPHVNKEEIEFIRQCNWWENPDSYERVLIKRLIGNLESSRKSSGRWQSKCALLEKQVTDLRNIYLRT